MIKRVAVITPVFRPNLEWLNKCIDSVLTQSLPCTHFLVLDGEADLSSVTRHSRLKIITLPDSHHDYGDTPRAIGSISAFRQGFEAVAWLDCDNWFEPNHIESLLELQNKTKVSICASSRKLFEQNETFLGLCPESGKNFIDTNCYLIMESEKALCSLWWLMDEDSHRIGDRILLNYLASRNIPVAESGLTTLCYRTNFEAHFRYFGKEPPVGAKSGFRI